MAAQIRLKNGSVVIVDDCDEDLMRKFRWSLICGYASTQYAGNATRMHRMIIGAKPGEIVDHINRNRLDNRRENLRLCSSSENAINSWRCGSDLRTRGVTTSGKDIRARINVNRDHYALGRFPSEKAAALAYDAAARVLHGEFAILNYPEELVVLNTPIRFTGSGSYPQEWAHLISNTGFNPSSPYADRRRDMQLDAPDAHQGAGPSRIPAELEAFFAMADRWKLSTDEQIVLLGSPGRSTFFKWKKEGGALPADTRERLSHILGIWKSLRILFTQDDRGEAWVRAKNRYFDGASALDVMLEGMSGVIQVRRYLDAQRGA